MRSCVVLTRGCAFITIFFSQRRTPKFSPLCIADRSILIVISKYRFFVRWRRWRWAIHSVSFFIRGGSHVFMITCEFHIFTIRSSNSPSYYRLDFPRDSFIQTYDLIILPALARPLFYRHAVQCYLPAVLCLVIINLAFTEGFLRFSFCFAAAALQ